MTTQNAAIETETAVNGVNTHQLVSAIESIQRDSNNAKFQFRVRNNWIGGGLNRSKIKDFFADGREDESRTKPFIVDSDQPLHVGGCDMAPTPVEYLLHALASCLTTTLVFHAAVQGLEIDSVESSIDGDIDVRGFFGMSDTVCKGFNMVQVRMLVDSDASVEQLTELAMYSPVYDTFSKSLPVEFVLEKV